MNTQLTYGKDAQKVGFADSKSYFTGDLVNSPSEKQDYIFNMANNCRGWFEPIFENESKFLPVKNPDVTISTLTVVEPLPLNSLDALTTDASALTVPPQELKENVLLNALIIGGAAMLIFKILS